MLNPGENRGKFKRPGPEKEKKNAGSGVGISRVVAHQTVGGDEAITIEEGHHMTDAENGNPGMVDGDQGSDGAFEKPESKR